MHCTVYTVKFQHVSIRVASYSAWYSLVILLVWALERGCSIYICILRSIIYTYLYNIETGRYELCGLGSKRGLPIEYRVCRCCHLNKVEDEIHFLLECPRIVRAREVFMKVCKKECWRIRVLNPSWGAEKIVFNCSALARYVRVAYTESLRKVQCAAKPIVQRWT